MNRLTRTLCALSAAAALMSVSCIGDKEPESTDPLEGWQLTWSDEFDGEAGTSPNAENWTFDIGGDGWGNRQLEFNTDRPENVSHDGEGNLAITARREGFMGNQYTSGRIKTQGLVEVEYGRIEARINLPVGQGIWPAFWMLGANFEAVGWPQCGEIDIMEFRGQDPAIVIGTVHGPGYSGGDSLGEVTSVSGGAAGEFHIYAVEWEPEEIRWYVNGVVYNTITPNDLPAGSRWVFEDPFFILLNLAVGGTFVGDPNSSTLFPQQMLIDYVRVYEKES